MLINFFQTTLHRDEKSQISDWSDSISVSMPNSRSHYQILRIIEIINEQFKSKNHFLISKYLY